MRPHPRQVAAHNVAMKLLEGRDVLLKDLEESPVTFVANVPRESVAVACLSIDVVVGYYASNWCDDEVTSVLYPLRHDNPLFAAKLREVLLPVVERYLAKRADRG